jgi:hypothetical protein
VVAVTIVIPPWLSEFDAVYSGGRSACDHRHASSDFNGSSRSQLKHLNLRGVLSAAGGVNTNGALQLGQDGTSVFVMDFSLQSQSPRNGQ